MLGRWRNVPVARLAPQITLRFDWPSYRIVMALFGHCEVGQHLYLPNTQRHGGSTLANVYFASLQRRFGGTLPSFITMTWMELNRFLG